MEFPVKMIWVYGLLLFFNIFKLRPWPRGLRLATPLHIRSQVKITQSQSYKLKKNAKTSNFKILQETLHTTHLLELLDKMYKYEMDPTRTVQATERTRDAGRTWDGRGTDRRTDRQTDGRSETNIPTNNFVVRGV